ncbi:MAG: DUF2867 domain-containing protein [Candidatus Eremiobacterota bacterium]
MKEEYNILVAGSTGYVGSLLIPALLKHGYKVRCLARNPDKVRSRNWEGAEVIKGDVLDRESLKEAVKGIDIAFYLVHAMGTWGDFVNRDALSASNFGHSCADAGVRRIIYLGGLGKSDDKYLSDHLKSRHQVGKLLGVSGVPVTELRASIIIGAGSASFEITRDLVKRLPLMITPEWVNSLCEPVSIDDVIFYLVSCIEYENTSGKILEIGGGEILTYLDMMRLVGEVMKKRFFVVKVPVLTPKLSAYWLNLVTSVPMSLAFPLVEGLKNDTICTDFTIRDLIPRRTMGFKESVKKALQKENTDFLESRWTYAFFETCSDLQQKSSYEILRCERVVFSEVKGEKIFHCIKSIGGNTGWYYGNWLFTLRGIFDRLIGGIGTRKGSPPLLNTGDTVDFWRVDKYEEGKYLKLVSELKMPGILWLEFIISSYGSDKSLLREIFTFIPDGIAGYIYWYVTLPVHVFLFSNMAKRIVKKAESTE